MVPAKYLIICASVLIRELVGFSLLELLADVVSKLPLSGTSTLSAMSGNFRSLWWVSFHSGWLQPDKIKLTDY